MSCLDTDTAARLVAGEIPSEELDATQAHVAQCEVCAALIEKQRQLSGATGATGETASIHEGSDPSPPPLDEDATLPRGTSLGRHILLERVGAGGMGVVYVAYDPRLDRKVAIKLLRPGRKVNWEPVAAQARLLREAQAMARLSHPNVLAVYDVGTWSDQVFLALEYVEGSTLREWLEERPRSWREIHSVFLSTGQGLAAAHAAGLVHRDFKPDNVMVSSDGRVRVMDFGLARGTSEIESSPREPSPALAPAPSELSRSSSALLETPLTHDSVVLGTPHYMAPEQAAGNADARADQYSFCVAFYEALFGEHPAKATGGAVESRHGRVPVRLRRALLRGVSRKPEDRFPSMQALLDELARDPAAARTRWLGAAAGLALIALASAVVWQSRRERGSLCTGAERRLEHVWSDPERQKAEAAFRATGKPFADIAWQMTGQVLDAYARDWVAMHTESCEATRIHGAQSDEILSLRMICLDQRLAELKALTDLFGNADGAMTEQAVRAAMSLEPLSSCEDVQALTSRVRPPSNPEARAKVDALRRQLAEAIALRRTGRHAQAIELAKPAVAEAIALGYKPVEAEALLTQGHIEAQQGRFEPAAATLYQAVWAAEEGHDSATTAEASIRLIGVAGYYLSRPQEGYLWAEHAKVALRQLGKSEAIEARLASSLASLYELENKEEEALVQHRRAFELRQKVLGLDHSETASSLLNIGNALGQMGRQRESLEYMQRAIAIQEKLLGPDHPELGRALINVAGPLRYLGRHEEALAALRRALGIWQRLGPENPIWAYAYANMGQSLMDLRRFDEALDNYRRALAIREKHHPPNDPRLGTTLGGMADVLTQMGRFREARKAYERERASAEKATGADRERLAEAETGLGQLALAEGAPKKALAAHQHALDIRKAIYGPKHLSLVQDMDGIGQALLAMRQPARARQTLEEAMAIAEGNPDGPTVLPELRFHLAKVVSSTPSQRERMRELLAQAREGAPGTATGKSLLLELDAWERKQRLR